MRFRFGFLVGFGAGYVLGAQAGRQRYEQIRQAWNSFMGNPSVQRVAERSKEMAGEAGRKSVDAVQQGVEKASGTVRSRLHGTDTTTTPIDTELPVDVGP